MSHGLGNFDAYRLLGSTNARYYSSPNNGVALTNSTYVANTLYLMPFLTPVAIEILAAQLNITTAVSSSTAEIGIYADNGQVTPGNLIADWGSLSTASTGVVQATSLTTKLPPGLYWLAVNPSGAIHMESFTTNNVLPILGSSSGVPASATNAVGYTASHTAGALPSTPGTLTVVTAPPLPFLALLLAGL